MTEPLTIAAIDIGSNSVQMIVARFGQDANFTIIDATKHSLRIPRTMDTERNIPNGTVKQLIQVLRSMKELAEHYQAHIRIVATHALRIARNQTTVVAEVATKLGLTIHIVDGQEEARLGFLGVKSALTTPSKPIVQIDIGGGSTELLLAEGEKIHEVYSTKVGTVTLTDNYLTKINKAALQAANLDARSSLGKICDNIAKRNPQTIYISSGTGKNLVKMIHWSKLGRKIAPESGLTITLEDLDQLIEQILLLKTPEAICARFPISRQRSEVIAAGAIILKAILGLLDTTDCIVSRFGIREGIAIDLYKRLDYQLKNYSQDIRSNSITNLTLKYYHDPSFQKSLLNYATTIFSQIYPFAWGNRTINHNHDYFFYLQAACNLLEIGKSINYEQYHRHSYYIIANTALLGFTIGERLTMAFTCLLSRKQFNGKDLANSLLSYEQQKLAATMSGCIRLSLALLKTRANKLKHIEVLGHTNALEFVLYSKLNSDLQAEELAFRTEKGQLAKAFTVDNVSLRIA